MKLWKKNKDSLASITDFTTGRDREMDLYLASFDVLGSLAHIQMLHSIQLITENELVALQTELKAIYRQIEKGEFKIEDGVEDIHSQIELLLTQKLGAPGKKIHSGRSRNDQVLVDIRLFMRSELESLVQEIQKLFQLLIKKSEEHQSKLLPGYTHLQLAMPSSFGLWFSAYAESLVDDVITLQSAYTVVNKNPLGSGAGYGSSFPIDRQMTTDLLGFDDLNYNVVYAQMGRGKAERITAQAMSNVAATLARLAMDVCLYLNQNFGFISFPEELTTGSSIMPHKKNPDVFELIRARCNALQALPNEITLMTANLPSGYHRDYQLLKEKLFPSFQVLKECLSMCAFMLERIHVNDNILNDSKYQYLFSVEEVNKLVLGGMPFREAYRKIGQDIESGKFQHSNELNHTHIGSMGNLQLYKITGMMESILQQFPFQKVNIRTHKLVE